MNIQPKPRTRIKYLSRAEGLVRKGIVRAAASQGSCLVQWIPGPRRLFQTIVPIQDIIGEVSPLAWSWSPMAWPSPAAGSAP